MSFNVNDQLTINGVTYRVAEHPAAPGFPYGQEGRAGIVYQLLPSPTGRAAGGEGAAALKVFKPRFRSPALLTQAQRLAPFAALPGLAACQRTILSPTHHPDLLRQHPDLTYAALMPWIAGPTWLDVLLAKQPLPAQQALTLARSLAEALEAMELRGIAHCDLSAANLILPLLAGGSGIALVDLEGLFAPGLSQPQTLSSGSAGYAHAQAAAGLWSPNADRFAGAVLLAEMLGWCAPEVTQAAWGESYFDPQEMQQDSARYQALLAALQRHWGDAVARLFARAWHSETLADCPTFGEWLVALPGQPAAEQRAAGAIPSPSLPTAPPLAEATAPAADETAADMAAAKVRALMQAARQMEEGHDLETALKLYQRALTLAKGDPALASLAREIALTIEHVTRRLRVTPPMPAQQTAAPAAAPAAEPRAAGRRMGWLGVVGLLLAGAAALVAAGDPGPGSAIVVGLLLAGAAALGVLWLEQEALIAPARPAQPNIPAASPAEAIPAEIPTETPAPTPTPIQIPVLTGTPYPPPREPLGPENAARVAQLARWGKGGVAEIAFSPDGRLLAVASSIGVYLYAAADLREVRFLPTDSPVHSVAFSPDSRLLASASDDRTIRLWDAASGALRRTLEGHTNTVRSVAFSPDGRLLASASDDRTIRLWDAVSGALRRTLEGHTYYVRSVAFSPDGRLLASGSEDNTIRLWDAASGALLRTLEVYDGVHSVTFSPDGRALASGSEDNTIRLWDAASGALLRTLEGHTDWVRSVAFSPDGRLLASASEDRTIRLWDAASGALLRTLEGHTRSVNSVAFSPDGRALASGSWDGTVRLWGVR
jgi:hypothetical protein